MAEPQNTNEDIIELTELIEKGDSATFTGSETVNTTVPEMRENAAGTAPESLNDASAPSPEGDIDFLLAQMDAGDKNETTAESANQAKIPADPPTAGGPGHIVDPHEKLDMSGMEEVDNLLSSLQIPLTPNAAEAGEAAGEPASSGQADASPRENAAPPSPDDIPFDIDSLLNPAAGTKAFFTDTDSQGEEEAWIEPPTSPPGSAPSPTGSAADAQVPEKTQTEVRELSAELDDILAAAGCPDLPEGDSPQQPPEKEEALSAAVEELPASQPPAKAQEDDSPARTQETQPAAEPAGPDENLFRSGGLPPPDDAVAEHALPVEKNPAPSQASAEDMPETERNAAEAVAPEAAMTETLPEEAQEPPSLPDDRLLEAENRLDALEKSLTEIAAQETSSGLAERLLEAENRLDALEKSLTEKIAAGAPEALEQRLTALESAALPLKGGCPAQAGENAQALHAYMELTARLDGTETRLNAVAELAARVDRVEDRLNAFAELATRVDNMETRLNAVTEQFEIRVEKAAAAAAGRLLREEIVKLLAS